MMDMPTNTNEWNMTNCVHGQVSPQAVWARLFPISVMFWLNFVQAVKNASFVAF
jgi:hypothetical protein